MKLAAILYAAIALDAVTFAAASSVPGIVAYEVNPLTRGLAMALGPAGLVFLKLSGGAVGALLLLRARGRWVRPAVLLVTGLVLLGAASNLLALEQLRGVL